MIDTNQLQQITDTAQIVKSQLQPWMPAIAVGAAWLGRELSRFNAWMASSAEKIIAHGGIIKFIGKLFWNKTP